MAERGAFDAVYAWVRKIPKGRVMTYGQIAALLDRPLSARAVGWAMAQCPEGAPWHRVVNAQGRCSTDARIGAEVGRQQKLLEAEGVRFEDGRLRLADYRYQPRARRRKPR